jgi:hypothetical protein
VAISPAYRYVPGMDLTITVFRRPTTANSRPQPLDNASDQFADLGEAIAKAKQTATRRGAEARTFQIKVTRSGDVVESWVRDPESQDGWAPRGKALSDTEETLLRLIGEGRLESTGPELRPVFEALIWAGFVWFVDGVGWTLTTAGQAEFDRLQPS